MKTHESIEKRCSIRNFSDKKVKWEHILEAIDAANHAPFAGNINNLMFIIVDDEETKNLLAENSQQLWMAEAPYIIAICADNTKITKLYDERGLNYAKQQTGAAIQNILLRLTELKLGTCWVGAYADHLIKKTLKLPKDSNYEIEALIPVGHPAKKPKYSKKAELENKIYWNIWGDRKRPWRKYRSVQ